MSDFKFKRHKSSKVLAARYGSDVQIGRHKWKIIFCAELFYPEGGDILGLCVPTQRTVYIMICDNYSTEETLVHELLHAECYEAGLRQMPAWNINLEELICEAASRALANYDIRRRRRA